LAADKYVPRVPVGDPLISRELGFVADGRTGGTLREEAMGDPADPQLAEIMQRALQFAEETLEHRTRIALEEIRRGVESSSQIEAAEREMRSLLS
jgi:hypothetical protein